MEPCRPTGRSSNGQRYASFNRSFHGCVAVASVGFGFGSGVIGAGATAQARMNLNNSDSNGRDHRNRKGYTFDNVEDNDVNVIVAC